MRSPAEGGGGDRVFESFLLRQREEGLALAASSDLLDLRPLDGPDTRKYVATLLCRGLLKTTGGRIVVAERFDVGIWFPADYLRRADTFQVVTLLGPRGIWHPNVHPQAPFICLGLMKPGTPLVDILYQCFEILTFNKVTMIERKALNHDACAWARRNRQLFPIDCRPLKRAAPPRRGKSDAAVGGL